MNPRVDVYPGNETFTNSVLFSVYVNSSGMDTSGSAAAITVDSYENIIAVPEKLLPVKYYIKYKLVTGCENNIFSTLFKNNFVISRRPFLELSTKCSVEGLFDLNSSRFRSSILDYGSSITLIFIVVAATYIWRIKCSHYTVATEYIDRCVA